METRIFPILVNTAKLEMERLVVYYPKIGGLPNIEIQNKINNTILNNVYDQIIQQGYYENPETEITGLWELKNNDKGILSLTLINYSYSGGAHGNTIVKALTFNIETGSTYQLSDLFKPGANYIKVLSEEVEDQIEERDIPTLEKFTSIKPNQDFYIADLCLVIFFQVYEITPYVVGIPYFPISIYEIEDIIDEKGPLGRMLS
ncbi:DUF3298 and DUF4163 domain-containing protein [Tissierella sp. MSJ-40]|uniref:DUF3298 and DUF4163 domain-containing protein n=1 Tax=Tissierella simiarum TaxID=2841534 RepID=A0ABS6E842_9FIRM|nr:DUF3298 and DUF4163 domain-containing protein [Tissierella simiarum]MBU5438934.1 DUF3298 and DUF4163 domain-containing protein [Tissierella simiarum]